MDDGKKICTFIGFSKLFLFDVKVEILLISSHFLMFSWIRPPPAHSLPLSFLCKCKVLGCYTSGPSFIYMRHVVLEF